MPVDGNGATKMKLVLLIPGEGQGIKELLKSMESTEGPASSDAAAARCLTAACCCCMWLHKPGDLWASNFDSLQQESAGGAGAAGERWRGGRLRGRPCQHFRC